MFFQLLVLSALVVSAGDVAAPKSPLPFAPHQGGVYVICHRGAHNECPENTLAAYRKAIELGADFVEIDLRTTKDNKLVSVHNGAVDAYTKDAKGPVSNFTVDELKKMDIGSRVGPQWANERIPTFDEILDVCKGKIGIYLDIKQAKMDQIFAQVHAHGMDRDVLWYSDPPDLLHVHEICPECNLMPEGGPAAMLPGVLNKVHSKIIASTWKSTKSKDYVDTCHVAGALLFTDDEGPKCWDDMLAWGMDGIQTNEPAKLIARLKAATK